MATQVLVIDDEEDYRIIIQEVLRGAGMDVRLAKDGEEGLRLVRAEKPHIGKVGVPFMKMKACFDFTFFSISCFRSAIDFLSSKKCKN